jgi:hypothetical protein
MAKGGLGRRLQKSSASTGLLQSPAVLAKRRIESTLLSLVLVEHPYGRNRTYVVVRFAFNNTVVLRYRLQLEARHLSASTINVRLAAVRRLAYEAADSGLPSPELAAMSGALAVVQKLGQLVVKLAYRMLPSLSAGRIPLDWNRQSINLLGTYLG